MIEEIIHEGVAKQETQCLNSIMLKITSVKKNLQLDYPS